MPDINEAINTINKKIEEIQNHIQFNIDHSIKVKYQTYEKQLFDYAAVLLRAKSIIDYKLWEIE